jgi:enamine deaminase RidA (YjgF/YER057c/UK114 family)
LDHKGNLTEFHPEASARMSQTFEKRHYNYGEWAKSLFSEAVTVTGPGKMIFLAGIGAEHEITGEVLFPGDFAEQCRLTYEKIRKVLARNGAGPADVVKQTTYVTDARYRPEATQIRSGFYQGGPLPAHTFLTVSQLAFPGMLIEVDIVAITPQR